MSQYYLMSQLPGLDGIDTRSALPTQVELYDAFRELCNRYLDPKDKVILDSLSLTPRRDGALTGSQLVDDWNRQERLLRIALATVRASNMKKSFEASDVVIPADILQVARTAASMGDPLAAEKYLNTYRIEALDRLRPIDGFSEDAVFFYGLKLMLLERMQEFDEEKGKESYQRIYQSILNGENQEK